MYIKNKKKIIQNVVLIYGCSKKYFLKNLTKKNTLMQKTNYLFDEIAIIKNKK